MVDIVSLMGDYNPWWLDKNKIRDTKAYKNYSIAKFRKEPNLLYFVYKAVDEDGILCLSGLRQVGKTTLLHLLINKLIFEKNVSPENILYFSCEALDKENLIDLFNLFKQLRVGNTDRKYLFLDEICHIKNWQEDFLMLSNKGELTNYSVVVSGSHAGELKDNFERLPGRRGKNEASNKILLPLKFSEFVVFTNPQFKDKLGELGFLSGKSRQEMLFQLFGGEINNSINQLMQFKKFLDDLLLDYFKCGGIPAVINDYKTRGEISDINYVTYFSAIIGDIKKIGLKEDYSKQLIKGIIQMYSNPYSWNELLKNAEIIKSHNTIEPYLEGLSKLFIVNKVFQKDINKNTNFRKDKKVYFHDPFIFNLFYAYFKNPKKYFSLINFNLLNPKYQSFLAETVVYNHLCRFAYNLSPNDNFDPTNSIFFYRDKKNREIDFLLYSEDKLYPFEVKYQNKIKSDDYKNMRVFSKGVLISKNDLGTNEGIVVIPLSIFLLLI